MKNRELKLIKFSCFVTLLFVLRISIYGQNAEVLHCQTDISCVKNKVVKKQTYIIQINNRKGDVYTEISLLSSKLIKVSNIVASIQDKNGVEVSKLKSSDIKDRSEMANYSLFEDNVVKEFALKYNEYPYIFKYSYQEEMSDFLDIEDWLPVVDMDIPTLDAELNLTVHKGYPIKYKTNKISDTRIDSTDNIYTYHWRTKFSSIPPAEIYSADLRSFFPRVIIVPLNFKFGAEGSLDNWVTYGNWQYGTLQNLQKLTPLEMQKIDLLLNGITDIREKVKVLYYYLQDNTRYINVSIQTGGMIPYPATYVCEKKYGDCKALSNYLIAMLQYAGIPADYTKIYAGEHVKNIDIDFPSQQFNHVIVEVPLNKDTMWLDATSDYAFGYLGTFTQNRYAYIIQKDASHLVRTPSLSPEETLIERHVNIRIDKNLDTKAAFENEYGGSEYEFLHSIYKKYGQNGDKEYIYNFIENSFELSDYQINDLGRDSARIKLLYHATTKKLVQNYGNDIVLKSIPFSLPLFETPKERKYDVQIDYPISKKDIQTYVLEDSTMSFIPMVPDSIVLNSKFGYYRVNYILEKRKLVLSKEFVLNEGVCELADYSDFYDFIKNVGLCERKNVFIIKKN